MKDKVNKTFVLKKAIVTGDTNTLFDLIKGAIGKYRLAHQRQMEPETDTDRIRLLNEFRFLGTNNEVCVASFFSFTMNENKNAVVLKNDLESFPIEVLAPKRNARHHQEFIAGLAWIAVMGNYIAVMTSQTFTFTALEDYFSWLFSRVHDKTIFVQFQDPKLPKFRDCDMSSVKRLEISNSIEVKAKSTRAQDASIRTHFVPEGRGWAVLKAIYNAMGKRPPAMGGVRKIFVPVIMPQSGAESAMSPLGS